MRIFVCQIAFHNEIRTYAQTGILARLHRFLHCRAFLPAVYASGWPDLARMDAESEMETGPGEYYLDSLAVVPSCRHHGIGKALLLDAIRKGERLGYDRIALVADSGMPHLVRLYESIGFVPADHRHAFGVDFQRMIYEVGMPMPIQSSPCRRFR